jgi:dihydrolipoamide dehydrogenase
MRVLYEANKKTACLVEMDEEPPHPLSVEAVEVVLMASLMMNAKPVDEVHVMRKTVIDGSNTTGFQRTSIIALDGYIKVNEYLETSKKHIYAFGDAIGRQMFKHAANDEAGAVWHNSTHDHIIKMDFSVVPHAVFTHPQVASVGLKEAEAKAQKYRILVGRAEYKDTAMGAALGYPQGFVKVIVEHETGKILGAHIIGPEASILIQEITNAMATVGNYGPIAQGIHIHPALNEVVQNAFSNLHEHE